MNRLAAIDWVMIAAYFAAVFAVALTVSRRKGARETAEGYFLGGRNAGWFVIGASLFASNIGSEHLVGLAGSGAARGLAVGHFEILASLVLLLLAWFFVPFYVRSGVFTMPEFLERRYSPAAQLAGLTVGTRAGASLPASDPAWRRRDVQFSIVLAAVVVAIWIAFSG